LSGSREHLLRLQDRCPQLYSPHEASLIHCRSIAGLHHRGIGSICRPDTGRRTHLVGNNDRHVCPPPPPLLAYATGASSGWFGGCPPRNEQEAAGRAGIGEALSPELNQKLAARFPPSSSADSLVRTLTEQGFELAESCQNDFTIRRAWFQGPTRGAMFETHAEI
jgi:hypothetical protein